MTQSNPFAQASSSTTRFAQTRFIPVGSSGGFIPPGTAARFPWQVQPADPSIATSSPNNAELNLLAPQISTTPIPIGLQNLRAKVNATIPPATINNDLSQNRGGTPYDILTRWGQSLSDTLAPLTQKIINLVFESDSNIPTVENPLPVGAILPNKALQAGQPNTTFAAGRYLSISQLRKQAQSVKV